jgi:Zn-dependent protease/CBS domain-containing protein
MSDQPRAPRRDSSGGLLIGRPFGVPVYVTPTWFIVAALITITYAPVVEEWVPNLGAWRYVVALAFAVLLYLSVLIHELSHTVVALRFGLPVRRITLYLLGGVSEIEKPAPTPPKEASIAFAGPLVSLLLGAIALVASRSLDRHTVAGLLAYALMLSNFGVGIFNLLPGLPLDGGRVLSAAVWKVTSRRETGTVVAAWCGRVVAVVVLVAPLLLSLGPNSEPNFSGLIWGALLASFIWLGASQSLQSAQVQRKIPGLSARALTRRAIPVPFDTPLAEAMRRLEESGARGLVVVSADGTPVGIVNEAAVRATPESRRPWVPVGDLSRRIHPDHVVAASLAGEDLVRALTRLPASEYLVVEENGDIYGVLASSDVERAVS